MYPSFNYLLSRSLTLFISWDPMNNMVYTFEGCCSLLLQQNRKTAKNKLSKIIKQVPVARFVQYSQEKGKKDGERELTVVRESHY